MKRHTPQDIAAKAPEILQCLAEAMTALNDPEVLHAITNKSHPDRSPC